MGEGVLERDEVEQAAFRGAGQIRKVGGATICTEHRDRVHSYELPAKEWGLA